MTLPVTAALAVAMAALLLLLAIDTVRQRLRVRAAFGTADDERLERASRAHGNLAEHAPLVVILVGLLEMSRANHMALLAIAGVFIIARVLHAIGLYMKGPENGPPWPRFVGVMLTWATIVVLCGWTFVMLLGNLAD
ncbi:MAPEG family protein [Parasphingopyxis marina]|uniref:MAPEG family protein n=1 Tax=Parasphingopyxis marina TaxID=2761622 RepID=A0A842I180_9SPHN|nr:MAPEG family protein [Parasphingopyxis marina]MBC2777524.1 MAPEG family protein [Parasphingopyxis marina]